MLQRDVSSVPFGQEIGGFGLVVVVDVVAPVVHRQEFRVLLHLDFLRTEHGFVHRVDEVGRDVDSRVLVVVPVAEVDLVREVLVRSPAAVDQTFGHPAMLESVGQLFSPEDERDEDDGSDGQNDADDGRDDFDDVALNLFIAVDRLCRRRRRRRRRRLLSSVLVLDLATLAFETFPTRARNARAVVRPPTEASVETPIDAKVRFFAVPAGAVFRTDAFSDHGAPIVGRDVALANAAVVADQVVAGVQLTLGNLVAAVKSAKLRGAVADLLTVEQHALAFVETLRCR